MRRRKCQHRNDLWISTIGLKRWMAHTWNNVVSPFPSAAGDHSNGPWRVPEVTVGKGGALTCKMWCCWIWGKFWQWRRVKTGGGDERVRKRKKRKKITCDSLSNMYGVGVNSTSFYTLREKKNFAWHAAKQNRYRLIFTVYRALYLGLFYASITWHSARPKYSSTDKTRSSENRKTSICFGS